MKKPRPNGEAFSLEERRNAMHIVTTPPADRFSATTPLTVATAAIATGFESIPAVFTANSAASPSNPAAFVSNAAEPDLTSNQSTSPIATVSASNPAEIDANTARSQLTDSKSPRPNVNLVNPSKSLKTSQREISRGGHIFRKSPEPQPEPQTESRPSSQARKSRPKPRPQPATDSGSKSARSTSSPNLCRCRLHFQPEPPPPVRAVPYSTAAELPQCSLHNLPQDYSG